MANIYDKASLVMIPSGTKTSKIFSQKPVNGDGDFTFSRSTAATRVNADGNIEKETQNLLTHSGDLTQWTPANTGTETATTDPLGGNKAFILNDQDAAAYYRLESNAVSITGVVTGSVYIKKTTGALSNYAGIEVSSVGSYIIIDTTNGTYNISSLSAYVDVKIESAYSDWWRVSAVVSNHTSGAVFNLWPAISSNGTSIANSAQGSNTFYAPQIEKGMVARDYIETTTAAVEGGITDNVPRLDYTDSSCPALLLEPQRTNVLTNSEYFSGWSTAGGTITRTDNATTSPEGVDNAARVVSSSTGARMRGGNVSVTSGEKWTYSIFAKENTTDSFIMRHEVSANFSVTFDLGDESFTGSGGWYDDAAIEDYGDGWYRCIVYLTADSTENRSFELVFYNNDDLYFYGAQAELGSYPTSYIPTYGTSVTRTADGDVSKNVSSLNLLGNTYSIFFDCDNVNYGTSNANFNYLNSSIGGSAMYVYGSTLGINTTTGDDYSNFLQGFTNPKGGKFLAVYNGSNVKIYKDGSLYKTISNPSARWDNATTYRLKMISATATISYNTFMLFPTALSNEEAIALTTI